MIEDIAGHETADLFAKLVFDKNVEQLLVVLKLKDHQLLSFTKQNYNGEFVIK